MSHCVCTFQFNPKEDFNQAKKRFLEVTGKSEEDFNKYYEQFKQALQHPVDAAGQAVGKASETASQAAGKVKETASEASDKMGEVTPDINIPGEHCPVNVWLLRLHLPLVSLVLF